MSRRADQPLEFACLRGRHSALVLLGTPHNGLPEMPNPFLHAEVVYSRD